VRIQGEEILVRAHIRSLDLYSGHADGPELAAWIADRRPVRRAPFLVHGETAAIQAMKVRSAPILQGIPMVMPALDAGFELAESGARELGTMKPPRLPPEKPGHMDWHNDLSRLMLDIAASIDQAADERAESVVIRRLRRALDVTEDPD
jgi:metallo-beta-lactamase family protein